jgi:hypothetical protein
MVSQIAISLKRARWQHKEQGRAKGLVKLIKEQADRLFI